MNIDALQAREPHSPTLAKYAYLGSLLSGATYDNREGAWAGLV